LPSGHHRTTLSGCTFATKIGYVSTIGKKLLNSNISSTCPHNMANVGPLTAEISLLVCGTPANFNRFRVLASLLQRRRSMEANQTLHDVWPSPGLVHYTDFWGLCPITEFCHVQNSLCIQVLRSRILAALQHGTSAAGVSQTVALSRGCHLYSVGRPSHWALAHIQVINKKSYMSFRLVPVLGDLE